MQSKCLEVRVSVDAKEGRRMVNGRDGDNGGVLNILRKTILGRWRLE